MSGRPAPNPTRPHGLGHPPPPPPLREYRTSVTWTVTCPDHETITGARVAVAHEGMLEVTDALGRKRILPGTCTAVQE